MRLVGLDLENFKCFEATQHLTLAPLTLLFGQNNSGKSSILQSLLLLQQSLRSGYDARLNLNGPLLNAGSFEDLVHGHDTKREVHITVALVDDETDEVELDLRFCDDGSNQPRLASLLLRRGGVEQIGIGRGRGQGGPYVLRVQKKLAGGQEQANFTFRAGSFLPTLGDAPPRRGRPSHRDPTATRTWANAVFERISDLLLGARALGPFRSPPERRYESLGVQDGPDLSGRSVVDALVQASRPNGHSKRRISLLAEANGWLERLAGVSLDIRKIDDRQRLYEIRIKNKAGDLANFADVGFGIGQALPVFVEGLRTPPGGLFIVQEPEIHLHPDAQLVMADFLIDLSRSGRQVIAETHSEHFLLRLRNRLVEAGKTTVSNEDVAVAHVARSGVKDGSQITDLALDELGQIRKWPKGFFQEANAERMNLLAAMAAKAEAE